MLTTSVDGVADVAFAGALLALLRFEWQLGGRRELYSFLRSPYSGFVRSNVDFLEGRLRGRGVAARESVEEETIRLRDGQPLPPLDALRGAAGPVEAVRAIAAAMLRAEHGLDALVNATFDYPPQPIPADALARTVDDSAGPGNNRRLLSLRKIAFRV